ncbi:MAG: FAD binding domain-containing protein [Elusimicrobiales bacterium]
MLNAGIILPNTLAEALRVLRGGGRALAGGTDLLISARRGGAPAPWVDISRLPQLRGIRRQDGHIFIGAAEKITDVGAHPLTREMLPALAQACRKFACPSLRNMATLGGNCANGSPAADGLCALCAENAAAIIANDGGIRKIPVESLVLGPKKTALSRCDIILGFELPDTAHKGVYLKLAARRSFAISKVSAGVTLRLENGLARGVSIMLGAAGPRPLRAAKSQEILEGAPLSADMIERAALAARDACSPVDDARSSAEYRRAMAAVLARRALSIIANDAAKESL